MGQIRLRRGQDWWNRPPLYSSPVLVLPALHKTTVWQADILVALFPLLGKRGKYPLTPVLHWVPMEAMQPCSTSTAQDQAACMLGAKLCAMSESKSICSGLKMGLQPIACKIFQIKGLLWQKHQAENLMEKQDNHSDLMTSFKDCFWHLVRQLLFLYMPSSNLGHLGLHKEAQLWFYQCSYIHQLVSHLIFIWNPGY